MDEAFQIIAYQRDELKADREYIQLLHKVIAVLSCVTVILTATVMYFL